MLRVEAVLMGLIVPGQGGLQDFLKFADQALLSSEMLLLNAAGHLHAAWRLGQSVQEGCQVTKLSASQAC